jgi:predicted PurR-regulated permease PerM
MMPPNSAGTEATGPAPLTMRMLPPSQHLLWIACAALLLLLLYVLRPILTPFILGAALAYASDPVVDRLEALKIPRMAGVIAVLLLMAMVLFAVLLILIPLLMEEIQLIGARLPQLATLLTERVMPWLHQAYGITLNWDAATLREVFTENWGTLKGVAAQLFQSLRGGGSALLGGLFTLVLTPIVTFYLLLAWDSIIAWIRLHIPLRWQAQAGAFAGEIDTVLGCFLRGQALVMLALSVYYALALQVAGLPSAVSVGVLTGLLIAVPYVGYALGLCLALLIALLQFSDPSLVIAVGVVYVIGQILEGFVLTPFLVGERIGLHPLAVLFALAAFGQLFGFIGVLIALPLSAVILVGLRHLRQHYLASTLYQGQATDTRYSR